MASLEPMVARTHRTESALATNKLIRNTYTLLAMTLAFSALTAGIAMVINMPPLHWLITLGGFFGLLFLTHKCANSAMGPGMRLRADRLHGPDSGSHHQRLRASVLQRSATRHDGVRRHRGNLPRPVGPTR